MRSEALEYRLDDEKDNCSYDNVAEEPAGSIAAQLAAIARVKKSVEK